MPRSNRSGLTGMYCSDGDTVEFFSESTIPSNFTAERAENAETLENPCVDWNALVLNSAPSAISALIKLWFFRQCPDR